MRYVEVVPAYPHKDPLRYKEDYFFWPAKMMMGKGFDAEFLTTQPGKDKETHKGVVIRRFGSPFKIVSYINRSPDVRLVHAHLRPYLPSFLSAFANKPKILSPHTYFLGSNPLISRLSVFVMNKFDRIIAFTPYEAEIYARAGIKRSRIAIIPHPVDYDFFSSPVKDRGKVRRRFGLKDEFVVATVANIRKFKRIDILLKAFKLFNEGRKATLIVVGKDRLWQENVPSVKDMIKDLAVGNVIEAGQLEPEGVREVFSVADVFVNTSDNEAQGLAVYEAAAAGVPLCLSSVGSFTTVFGELALYHKFDDPAGLSENLARYHHEAGLRREMSGKLRRFIKAWDFGIIKGKMEDVYSEVAGL